MRHFLWFMSVALTGFSCWMSAAAADDIAICGASTGDDAIAACTRLIVTGNLKGSDLVLAFTLRGMRLAEKGQFDRAIQDYDKAIKLDPKSEYGYGGRGTAYQKMGEHGRAIADFNVAIRLNQQSVYYVFRGKSFFEKRDYDKAMQDYDQALRLNPANIDAYRLRSEVYYFKDEYDRAIADLNNAIRLDPTNAILFAARGSSFSRKGDYGRAISDLSEAIRFNPKSIEVYLKRGLTYEDQNDLNKALADYRAALTLNPQERVAAESIQRVERKLASGPVAKAIKLQSTGSGFLINSRGFVLTNHHVVEDCPTIRLQTARGSKNATVIASDKINDLAVVRADLGEMKPLPFREGRGIRPAETVLLVGFPYSGMLATSPNVSTGAVSALAGLQDDTRFLQISAPIQPGNSGGPLLDTSGGVVGVVVATMNASIILKETGSIPQNVNFAIKSAIVREFLDSKGITYETLPVGPPLEIADIGEKGARSTVLVECYK